MIQPATNESSNTTEEGSSSSAVSPQPIHGRPQYNRGTLVQQVAYHMNAYMKHQGVSDEKRPRMMNTAPPSLWFKAIWATVVRILPGQKDEHILDFEQDDIPTATTDPDTHNMRTHLWSQRISTEHALNKLLDSGLDVDIEDEYFILENVRCMSIIDIPSSHNNSHKHPPRTLITNASVAQDETPPSVRTSMGELDKQEAQKAMRLSTLNSKDAQPETQIKEMSDTPLKIESTLTDSPDTL